MGRGVLAGLALGALCAAPALAHPHVYIDTGIEVIFDDQGRAAALRITWAYDDFFSLMVVQDRGLDPDADGEATPEEDAKLNGFDMEWEPGFEGDTYVLVNDQPLALGAPTDFTGIYRGGRLISTHTRAILQPADPEVAPVIIQSYDPGFYTAYTIASDPVLTGREGCAAPVFAPDLSEADKQLQAALAEYGADVDLEMDFPAIGAAYAEEVRLTCENPS
jgi:polyphosphate kinase